MNLNVKPYNHKPLLGLLKEMLVICLQESTLVFRDTRAHVNADASS